MNEQNYKKLLEIAKQITADKHKAEPCPSCGYCPHCGRSNQQLIPYYVPYPVYPTPRWHEPYITWTTSSREEPMTKFQITS